MDWFEKLTGFAEGSPQQVRNNLVVKGDKPDGQGVSPDYAPRTLKERRKTTGDASASRASQRIESKVNGKTFVVGKLETPSLGELRQRIKDTDTTGKLSIREVVADVQSLHTDPANAGALFQVASQFNLLEMVSPNRTPEAGIGIYSRDRTQGPACAIACGAGTIYRNYFVPVNGQIGQSSNSQIDCLSDLGKAWNNSQNHLWRMKNGYALATHRGLTRISQKLQAANEAEIDEYRQLLRIGIQWQTQVTLKDCQHQVSQIYCSALPVAYSPLPVKLWSEFAKLILEAAYEATICAAILNARANGNNQLFLTLLGGGAFGNETGWIIDSIARALRIYQNNDLNIAIVSYGLSKPAVQKLVKRFNN